MDTIADFAKKKANLTIDKFYVAGASKVYITLTQYLVICRMNTWRHKIDWVCCIQIHLCNIVDVFSIQEQTNDLDWTLYSINLRWFHFVTCFPLPRPSIHIKRQHASRISWSNVTGPVCGCQIVKNMFSCIYREMLVHDYLNGIFLAKTKLGRLKLGQKMNAITEFLHRRGTFKQYWRK